MIIKSYKNFEVSDLEKLGSEYTQKLPKEYIEFLGEFNGGDIVPELGEGIIIPVLDCDVKIRKFLGVNTENVENNLEYWTELRKADILDGGIIFAKDGHGGFFLIIDGKVVYWDDCNYLAASSESGNSYIISDSFSMFWQLYFKDNLEEKGENIQMEKIDYLPLGSIVLLEGGIQKLVIISRGIQVEKDGTQFYFDYAGAVYPIGLYSDQAFYFNSENIREVVFTGYSDGDDKVIVDSLNKFLQDNPDTIRGSVEIWNQK